MLDQRAIDLEQVERLPAQLLQAGVAGAEVVHRDPDAGLAGGLQRGAARGAQRLSFGHFADQPVEAGHQSELLQHLDDLAVADHHGRHVDADEEIGESANSGCTSRRIALSKRHISCSRCSGSLSIASINGPIERAGASSSGILASI